MWFYYFLLLAAGLVILTSALPSNSDLLNITTAANVDSIAYHGSIQLLYSEQYGDGIIHAWHAFVGPQGIAMDICGNDKRFNSPIKPIIHDKAGGGIDYPPYPLAGKWPIPINNYKDCNLVFDGRSPGQLRCGDYLITDFRKDPGYDREATKKCANILVHRGYFTEF